MTNTNTPAPEQSPAAGRETATANGLAAVRLIRNVLKLTKTHAIRCVLRTEDDAIMVSAPYRDTVAAEALDTCQSTLEGLGLDCDRINRYAFVVIGAK